MLSGFEKGSYWVGLACLQAMCWAGCAPADESSEPGPGVALLALQGPQEDVAALCGFTCAETGLTEGNGRPSGVTSPDAFFTTVLSWRDRAESLSLQIETELAAAGADFGVSGDLGEEIQTLHAVFAEGPLAAQTGEPDCRVDASALNQWLQACDSALDGTAGQCAGRCALPTDAEPECGDTTDRVCTFGSPGRACAELCQGLCAESMFDATCAGDCLGSCDGTCTRLDADGGCAGHCNGICQGQCVLPLMDPERCQGVCMGRCTETNPATCSGALQVQCVAPSSGEAVPCEGRCDGEQKRPGARLECSAAASAQGAMRLRCSHGAARLRATPAPVVEDAAAQARYLSALHNLEQRLPGLWVLAQQGERVFASGDDLIKAAADRALADSFDDLNAGSQHTRFAVGLECAAAQLPKVEQVISAVSPRLEANLEALDELRRGLGMEVAP